jgi:hypothetical protein
MLFSGCGFGGGGSNVVGVPTTPATDVTIEANVSTSGLSPALRANLNTEDIQVLLDGVPLSLVNQLGDIMVYRLSLSDLNDTFKELIAQGGGVVELTVIIGGDNPVTQNLEVNTMTDGYSWKSLSVGLNISYNAAEDEYIIDVIGGSDIGPVGAPGQLNKSLGVTGVDYLDATGEYKPLAYATSVPYMNTTVRITFDTVVDKVTNNFKIMIGNDSGALITLTHNEIDRLFSIEQTDVPASNDDAAYSFVTITLLSDKNDKGLTPGKTYTASFESGSVSSKDSPYVKLRPFTVIERSFTTASE